VRGVQADLAGLVAAVPALRPGDGGSVKIEWPELVCLIMVACLVIMTIALGHMAWGW
jgi:hypothetical protein